MFPWVTTGWPHCLFLGLGGAGLGVSYEPEFVTARAQLLIWINDWAEVIDVEEVELEEKGRCPGALVFSSSHQMLPGELQGSDWGRGSEG